MIRLNSLWRRFTLLMAVAAIGAGAQQGFPLGVASGEVTPGSAVLWTKAERREILILEVSPDPHFESGVQRKAVLAREANDLTAKFIVTGLTPSTRYYYRWVARSASSSAGTFRTAPSALQPATLRFAFSGDSDGTKDATGAREFDFRVLSAVQIDDPDFFVYLGDTVYQDSSRRPAPAVTLEEYRATYRVNREVLPLNELLASTPIYAAWDDHEVFNDYDGTTVEPGRFETARKAFFEYMPLKQTGVIKDPSCPSDPMFRRFRWGSDVEVIVLDTRTCRSADATAACRPGPGLPDLAPTLPADIRRQFLLSPSPPPGCLEAINDPSRTLLGAPQKEALQQALLESTARFKFIMNQVPIQQFFALPYDRWEGYAAERAEILNFIRDNRIRGVVFLATDMHANLVNEVFLDNFADPEPLALEFVTGPIGTDPFAREVAGIAGSLGLAVVNQVFELVGANCRDLNAFSYGLIEVDGTSGIATVTLKDENGQVIVNQGSTNPGEPCVVRLLP